MRTRDLAKPSYTASATHRERERAARRLRLAEIHTRRQGGRPPRDLRSYVHQIDRSLRGEAL